MSLLTEDHRPPGSIPAAHPLGAHLDDPYVLFGWLALFDALNVINERDPHRRRDDLDTPAIASYVGRRRDALLHHHCPHFVSF